MNKKVALVTGASSGIGTAVSCILADHGYRVMAAGRDAERTEKLRKYSPNIETWTGDIGNAKPRLSTIERYASAVGYRLEINFVPEPHSSSR